MTGLVNDTLSWLISNASLPYRIAAGALVFVTLAIVDLRKHGPTATRWREYVFLLTCVAVAIVYGITNDLITSRISPEYFLYFKGAVEHVSNEAAANPSAHRGELDLQAIRIGTLATWTAGLVAGALLLTANSLGAWPRLRLSRLARGVSFIGVLAACGAVVLGIVGGRGGLLFTSGDFREMVARDEMRPYRVMCVYGIHLGGYLGATLALLIACARTISLRRKSQRPKA